MGHPDIVAIIVAVVVVILLAIAIAILVRRKTKGHTPSNFAIASGSTQLYVGNLSYRVHERDLRRFFSKYGEISNLKVVKDRETRRSKGFGFVTFESPEDANKALSAHGMQMSGRNIVVRLAKPRS